MKLVIAQDGVKRRLADKPFALCLDRDTAEALVRCLSETLQQSFVYGWVPIHPAYDIDFGPSSTEPESWARSAE